MVRLAHTSDGTPWVGNADGFVPVSAVEPDIEDGDKALRRVITATLNVDSATAKPVPASQLEFGLPISQAKKLWGIGLNYVDHADDLDATYPDEPASFLKPPTTAIGPDESIRLPPSDISDHVTAEAELGVVIGRTCKDISIEEADRVIAGFVPIIDMTAEDILQRNPRFLTRAKSFDTFLVAGPWIATQDEVESLADLTVRTVINDTVIAENEVENMCFSPRELVAFHSQVMTLQPGDIISTGTPGAGEITAGDTVRAEVEDVGVLSASVTRRE